MVVNQRCGDPHTSFVVIGAGFAPLRPITIRIGTPIPVTGTAREDLVRAGEEAAQQIQTLLGETSEGAAST